MNNLDTKLKLITATPYAQIIVLILIFIVYGQTINFKFSYLDDNSVILEQLTKHQPVFDLKEAFVRDAFYSPKGLAFYRPIQNVSYQLDALVSGTNPFFYHFSNIFIHILTCLSLFHLLKLLKYDAVLAFIGTLIFAVHPMFTHAVAWIPSRGDLLIALFGVLEFVSFIKLVETHEKKYLIFSIILYAVAGFTKENALLFPIVFFIYFLIKESRKNNYLYYILAMCYLLIMILFYYLRSTVVIHIEGDNSFGIHSFFQNLQALPEMYAKTIIPLNLSTMPMYSLQISLLGIALIILTIIYFFTKKIKLNGLILFGLIWFLIFSVPGMFYRHNYADFSYEYFEHRGYLPAIGLIIMIFEIFRFQKIKIESNKKILTALMILVLFFTGYTYMHAGNYYNIFSFYGWAIKKSPNNALAFYNLGNYYKENNNYEKAKESYLKCIEINPEYIEAYQNLAANYEAKDEHASAIENLEKALKLNQNYPSALKLMGIIYNKLGQNNIAKTYLERCLQIIPDDVEGMNALGVVYADLNQPQTAEQLFKKILAIDKDYKLASNNLTSLYKNKGDKKKVIQSLQQSVSTNPKSSEAYNSLGEEYGRQGNIEKAMEMLQKAIEIDPTNARAYNNLGTAYAMTKQFAKAITMYANAAKYDPQNGTFLLNYGLALNDNKQKKEAIAVMKKAAQMNNQVAIQWLREQGN